LTYAVLGDITFRAIDSPESFESQLGYDFAEHKVVQAPPRLQWISNALEEISVEMFFHVSFTKPAAQIAKLRAAASAHKAMALVFGNGVHRGYFVITAIVETAHKNADDGSVIAITAKLSLKEWVRGADIDPLAPPKPATTPPAIVKSTGAPSKGIAVGPTTSLVTKVLRADGTLVFINTTTGEIIKTIPPEPGLSALLSNPPPGGPPSAAIAPGDVPPSQIVRSANGATGSF
jgi:phage protein U